MPSDSDIPTRPYTPRRMTVAEAKEALLAFPADQQPLIQAMNFASWDDGASVGYAQLPRINPWIHHPTTEPPATEQPKRKRR